jgi:TRAP-type transport system small permease protein
VNRFTDNVDRICGLFLAAVAVLTVSEASLRYVLGLQIPDWYVLACLLQGIAIFWGISSTTYQGKHIVVDLLWEMSSPAVRRVLDVVADLITFAFLAAFAIMLIVKVNSTYRSNELSPDLGFVIWPFHLVAALGIASALLLSALRLWQTIKSPLAENQEAELKNNG